MLIDAQAGQAHNIDDVDISQFNKVFIVNPSVDNPLQEFQTVKIQLIEETVTIKEEQEKIDQKVVEQIEVNVNTQAGDVQTKDQDGKVNEDTTEQNKTKEMGENSVRKDDNINPDDSSRDVMQEYEDMNPDDASADKKHDVTVSEEKDDTTNPDNARNDTKCDNDNNTKETGETSDVTNEKEGENDKESDVKEHTMHDSKRDDPEKKCDVKEDTKRDVTESDDPEKNRDVTEDNQVEEKVNEGTEEQKDKENAEEENDTSESDIVVLAQYKERQKNIDIIDLMTSSSDENKRDVIDEDAEEQKRDITHEGVERELKWQKVPRKIAVKRFYKRGKAYLSEGDVHEKDGSLSDGGRHKTDVSPDKCVVTFLKNAVKIKDTVLPRRSEKRSQYSCGLA